MKSSAKQRQDIGFLRKLLGLSDDVYYEMISAYDGAQSSKDLSIKDAAVLINKLRDDAKSAGLWKPKASTRLKQYKYNNLAGRAGMASPAQLRKTEAMWAMVSRAQDFDARRKALNKFIYKITGKDALPFLTASDARKVIKALDAMQNA